MAPLEIGAVLLQVSLFLSAGYALARVLLTPFRDEGSLGAPEWALCSLAGGVAWAVVLMVAHMITGGAVFGYPVVVPVLTAILLSWSFTRSSGPTAPWRSIDRRMLAVAALVLGALYVLPMIVAGSPVRSGDSPWHLGWTEQLLAGERVPTGPAPEFGRNAYPWGFHGVIATLVRLVPGSSPLVALAAVHVLLVAGIPLAGASLARRFSLRAGLWGAATTALVGGFGWLFSGGPSFGTSPRDGTAGADLVVASPNSVYELLPPPLPRELGLVLLAAAGVLLVVSRGSRSRSLVTGSLVGLVGLVSVPMFLSALTWVTASVVMADRGRRRERAIRLVVPAFLVFGAWAMPVALDYVRFGGFVDITPRLGKEWTLFHALASWGLLLPLAVAGFVVGRRAGGSARLVIGFATGSVLLLVAAYGRGIFDWSLAGNATILHQGRIWPPLHLLGGALGGVGVLWLADRLGARSGSARAAVAGVFVLGAMSPFFASIALTEVMSEGRSGFVYGEDEVVSPESFVQRAAAELGPRDVVEVEGPDGLAFLLWQFSGTRLASYDHPGLAENDLRIRFRDRAAAWQAVVDGEGFEPDYRVVPVPPGGPALPSGLAAGRFDGTRWVLIASN